MRHHKLVRFSKHSGHGTFGRLEKWVTMEDDDRDNQPNVSSIAPGAYVCRRTMFDGRYETFEVTGVSGRSHIKFHIANLEEDVEGCIGVGLYLGILWQDEDEDTGEAGYKMAVLNSATAFEEFMDFFEGVDEWILIVEDYKP